MNKSFDAKFSEISELRWIPWIGDNYESASCKILLVGESVYATSEDPMESYDAINSNPDYVRDRNVSWWANCPMENLKSFPKNTMNVLCQENSFLNDEQFKSKFWNGVAFTEVVQEAMTDINQRPSQEQRKEGLKALFKVLDILKPNFVLFLGNESLKDQFMKKAVNDLNVCFEECQWKESENVKRNHFRVSSYNQQYPLMAIPHPSRKLVSDNLKMLWHNEIKREFPEIIDYFNSL